MSQPFEAELRCALRETVDELPDGAGARVRARDYHTRTRARRLATAGSGALAGGLALVAGISIIGLGSDSGTPPAYAGWSAEPTRPAGGQIAAAEQRCSAWLPPSPGSPTAPWRSVLADTRGPFTMMIFESQGHFSSCFAEGATNDGGSGQTPPPAAPGQIEVTGWANSPADPYTVIYGRVGAGVSAVRFPLVDGATVQATVSNGWFAAWWPGSEKVETATLTTARGSASQDLSPFAVARDPDGSVTLTLRIGNAIDASESGADANAALAKLGVDAELVPIEPSCPRPTAAVIPFAAVSSSSALGAILTQSTASSEGGHAVGWRIQRAAIPAGDTLVIAGPEEVGPGGPFTSRAGVFHAPAPLCAPER